MEVVPVAAWALPDTLRDADAVAFSNGETRR